MTKVAHIPVLLNEVIEGLAPQPNKIYIDATFGRGGYSKAILEAADCRVIGIDRDPEAIATGHEFEKTYQGRFKILSGPFSQIQILLHDAQVFHVHGIAFDLGVSSPQLDNATRGFSFRFDGPLDMRMSQEGESAADIVNDTDENDLANIIYQYGEERASRRIAKAIVEQRKIQKFSRTLELAQLIEKIMPRRDETHPATKTFQALRIAVNGELDELQQGLEGAEELLHDKGRLAVVTFHSLEDRIVKNFLRDRAGKNARGSRHKPDLGVQNAATFHLINSKAVTPSRDETQRNARSRSAKLRVAERIGEVPHAA
ncbi:MAG: S-adenosyl-methyltransferase mraW [Alphaproteobacteria bacterium]|nr:S-adenosyl-methyltransferase mraW [Alphaproteobacteria bacterium]